MWAGTAAVSGWARGKTAAVPFLTLDVSARSAGMGGAQAATVDDAGALVGNPAGLRRLARPSLSLFHATYVDSSYFDFVGMGRRAGRRSAFGVGAQFLSQGRLERIDSEGTTTGNFSPNDLALSFGYAAEVSGIHFGLAGKFIQSKLVDTATGFAVDAGVVSPPLTDNQWRFAAVVANVGPEIKYRSTAQALPFRARVGFSFAPAPPWLVAGDAVVPGAGDPFGAAGIEYHMPIEGSWNVTLRGGYNTQAKEAGSLSGFGGGLGFAGPSFGVDYSLVTLGDLGLSHRISLNLQFGSVTKPPPPKKFPLRFPD